MLDDVKNLSLVTQGTHQSAWRDIPHGDTVLNFRIRISRNTLVAVLVSLLVHLLLLITFLENVGQVEMPPTEDLPQSFNIELNKPTPAKVIQETPQIKSEPPPPESKAKPVKPKKLKNPVPLIATPRIIAVDKPDEKVVVAPVEVPKPPPLPTPAPTKDPAAPTDMLALVNANRERRRLAEGDAAEKNAEARAKDHVPTPEEQRDAVIKRNLQQPGANSVFQVSNVGLHSAQLSFKVTKYSYSAPRYETFDVDAGIGGDLNRALVKKLVELIRKYYKEDFQYESILLGRTLTLSPSPEDSEMLESVLLSEMKQLTKPNY